MIKMNDLRYGKTLTREGALLIDNLLAIETEWHCRATERQETVLTLRRRRRACNLSVILTIWRARSSSTQILRASRWTTAEQAYREHSLAIRYRLRRHCRFQRTVDEAALALSLRSLSKLSLRPITTRPAERFENEKESRVLRAGDRS